MSGISAVFATVLAAAVLRDCFSGQQLGKAISITSMLWAIIPSIAPVIGGYVIEINHQWQDIFLLIFIVGVITLFLTVFWLPETLPKSQRHPLKIKHKIKQYAELLSNRKFVSHTLSSALSYSLFTAYITAAPVLLKINFNTTAVEIGWLQLIYAITYIAGTFINSLIISKLGFSRSILTGKIILLFGIIALLGLFIYQNIFLLLIPMMIIQFSNGFTFPNYCALALIPHEKLAGLAGALLVSIQLIICFAVSYIIATLPTGSLTAYAVYIGIIGLIILLLSHKD